MNIAIIDVKINTMPGSKFTSVNNRNAEILAKELRCDLYQYEYQLNKCIEQAIKYDVIIYGFGSKFTEVTKTRVIAKNAKAFFWLITEYEQSMNPALYYSCKDANLKYIAIKNYDSLSNIKMCNKSYFINLNLLIAKNPNKITIKKYDCIYYSRWRPGRAKYLNKYLQKDIYFSSDNKNYKYHKNIGCNPKYIKKLSWQDGLETLNHFRYSLYIEDEYTHNVFNNLANRWYEAGFCNNVVFFDKNCMNTILKSELHDYIDQVKDYIVDDYNELIYKINECNNDFEKHLAVQKSWRKNELQLRKEMIDQLKDIINNHAIQS